MRLHLLHDRKYQKIYGNHKRSKNKLTRSRFINNLGRKFALQEIRYYYPDWKDIEQGPDYGVCEDCWAELKEFGPIYGNFCF